MANTNIGSEVLHVDQNRRIVQYDTRGYEFLTEINAEKQQITLDGVEKANTRGLSRGDERWIRNNQQKIKQESTVPEVTSISGNFTRFWSPSFEVYIDRRGDCPATQFDHDYELRVAIDTGLPSIPGLSGSKIEELALEVVCELVGDILKPDVLSKFSSSSTKTASLPVARIARAAAAVLVERACSTLFEPFVGLLADGAATWGFYDCHDPSSFTNLTSICMGMGPGQIDEPGELGDGFPALPGAHLGMHSRPTARRAYDRSGAEW